MPTGDFSPPPGSVWSDALGWHVPVAPMTPAVSPVPDALREALETLITAFVVSDDGTVTIAPGRLLSVALLNARGVLEDTHVGPLAEEIADLRAERDAAVRALSAERESHRITDVMAGVGFDHMVQEGDRARVAQAEIAALRARVERVEADVEAVLTDTNRMSVLLLAAGEMTAQERRTARAIASYIAGRVRSALLTPPRPACAAGNTETRHADR